MTDYNSAESITLQAVVYLTQARDCLKSANKGIGLDPTYRELLLRVRAEVDIAMRECFGDTFYAQVKQTEDKVREELIAAIAAADAAERSKRFDPKP